MLLYVGWSGKAHWEGDNLRELCGIKNIPIITITIIIHAPAYEQSVPEHSKWLVLNALPILWLLALWLLCPFRIFYGSQRGLIPSWIMTTMGSQCLESWQIGREWSYPCAACVHMYAVYGSICRWTLRSYCDPAVNICVDVFVCAHIFLSDLCTRGKLLAMWEMSFTFWRALLGALHSSWPSSAPFTAERELRFLPVLVDTLWCFWDSLRRAWGDIACCFNLLFPVD